MSATSRARAGGAFVAGGLAMTLAVLVVLVLRVVAQQATLPELIGDQLVRLIPGNLFEVGIQTLGPLAKKVLFVILTLGMVGIGGLLGVWLDRWRPLGPRRLDRSVGFALRAAALALLVGGFLTGLLGGGNALFAGLGTLLIQSAVFGVGLAALAGLAAAPVVHRGGTPVQAVWYPSSTEMTRRGLLVLGATAVTATVAAMVVGNASEGAGEIAAASAGTAPASGSGVATPAGAAAAAATTGASTPAPAAAPAVVAGGAPTAGAGTTAAGATASSSGTASKLTLPLPKGVPPEITPTGDFYVVSKNFFSDPRVSAGTWSLRLEGLVEKPATFTLDALKALPAVERQHTLTCISNEVGGDLISNGTWKGTRLADLLKSAGVKPAAKKVVLYAADGYTDSIVLDKAMDPGALLVYEMNGAALPAGHGFPLRLLVPDIYGMKNAKWITKIELVSEDFKGYWEQQGWSDPAQIKTMSRIDVAKGGAANEPTLVAGIAYAGERGIRGVQISDDGGKTWIDAQVKLPNTPNVWTLWVAQWTPKQRGTVALSVRAIDGTGAVQTQTEADPFPDGSSGWHTVQVNVS